MIMMTEKERQLINDLCEQFDITPEDTEEETLESYWFTSWCSTRGGFLSLKNIVCFLRKNWYLEDNQE